MATRYALLEYTDASGTHEPGDKIEVAADTDIEKANDQRLLDTGVYSKTQPRTGGRASAKGEQDTK